MRDLLPANASGRFAPSAAVVIFFYFDIPVASLFRSMRDLLPDKAPGRFAPSAAVVIFYYFDISVASLFNGMVQSKTRAVLKAKKNQTIASLQAFKKRDVSICRHPAPQKSCFKGFD